MEETEPKKKRQITEKQREARLANLANGRKRRINTNTTLVQKMDLKMILALMGLVILLSPERKHIRIEKNQRKKVKGILI
ncbi:MAG TPA: hypothetical protein PLS50_07355 [Candidatus Dojkabacteria bacterium]|nr:hypothetical protein [Candidatus Dojkabacteria bacterium]